MLTTPLSPWLDSRKLCNAQQQVEGTIELSKLDNLCSYLASNEGIADVSLQFQRDAMSRAVAVGHVRAENVAMTCQRCLEAASFELQANIDIVMVATDEQAAALEKEYNNQLDVWVVGDGQLNILQLLEQELVLSLPMVPYHKDCQVKTEYGVGTNGEQKANPFGVLAELLAKD